MQLNDMQNDTIFLKGYLMYNFQEYISSREGLTTLLFRNKKLTQEKKDLAIDSINLIFNFQGTTQELRQLLVNIATSHASISKALGYNSFNLLGEKVSGYTGTGKPIICSVNKDGMQPDESWFKSDLAHCFHYAILILKAIDEKPRYDRDHLRRGYREPSSLSNYLGEINLCDVRPPFVSPPYDNSKKYRSFFEKYKKIMEEKFVNDEKSSMSEYSSPSHRF